MDIFIETLTGTAFELRVSQSDTILSIKNKIQRHEDYEIIPGCTLKLVLKIRGGPMNTYRPCPSFKFSSLHVIHPMYSKTFLDPLKKTSKANDFSDCGSGSSTDATPSSGSSDEDDKNASSSFDKEPSLNRMAKDLVKFAKAAEKKITLLILDYEDHIKLLSFPNESGSANEAPASEAVKESEELEVDAEKVGKEKLPVLKETPEEQGDDASSETNGCDCKPSVKENVSPSVNAKKEAQERMDSFATFKAFANRLEPATSDTRLRDSILNQKLPNYMRWESDKHVSGQKSDDSDYDQKNNKCAYSLSKMDMMPSEDFGLSPPEDPNENNEDEDSNDEDFFIPGWEGLWLGYRDERGSLGSTYNAYSGLKGGPISATRSSVNLGRIPSTPWTVECDQMAAKVAGLKAEMAERRLRKQKKHKLLDLEKDKDTQSDDIVCSRKFLPAENAPSGKLEKKNDNSVSDVASVDAATSDLRFDCKDFTESVFGTKSRGDHDHLRLSEMRYSDELFNRRQSISNRFKPWCMNPKSHSTNKNIELNTLHSHNFPLLMSPQSSKRKPPTSSIQDHSNAPVPVYKSEESYCSGNLPSIPSNSINRLMTQVSKPIVESISSVDKVNVPPLDQATRSSESHRCKICNKRTGLANSYSCRCGQNFCARHRYAESHSCQYDYKTEAREVLRETNPVVAAAKLPKI